MSRSHYAVITRAFSCLLEAYQLLGPEGKHAFNASILCCLPQKTIGQDDEHGAYYTATRPFNTGNVDNRLLAGAAGLAWEPILEAWVSDVQRGFLEG